MSDTRAVASLSTRSIGKGCVQGHAHAWCSMQQASTCIVGVATERVADGFRSQPEVEVLLSEC